MTKKVLPSSAYITLVMVMTACATTSGTTRTTGTRTEPAASPANVPEKVIPNSWSFSYLPDSASYIISRIAVIEVAGNSTRRRSDSTYTRATMVLTALPDSVLDVSLHIEAASDTSRAEAMSVAPVNPPVAVRALLTVRELPQLRFENYPDSLCNSTRASLTADLVNLLPTIPAHLTAGMTWQDSAQINTCQSGVRLTANIVHVYRVIGETSDSTEHLLQITRVDSISARGIGVLAQHQLSVEATGHGEADTYIDTGRNKILRIETSSITAITVSSNEGLSNFQQRLHEKFELVH